MSILQMSFSGAVLILIILVLRALTMNRLPKDTFLILWGIVLFRLIVPFSVPSELSVYSWIGRSLDRTVIDSGISEQSPKKNLNQVPLENIDRADEVNPKLILENDTHVINYTKTDPSHAAQNAVQAIESKSDALNTDNHVIFLATAEKLAAFMNDTASIRLVIWCVGMLACMTYFTQSYLRCRFEFQTSVPVENLAAQRWLTKHCCRTISIRQSDRISTPLTYGIWRPVILMPKDTDWENTQQLQYILAHEYIHICRCDALTKLVCIFALCIHWFNPLVWIMYVFFNRDVEISCDEHVVRRFGESAKSVYAKMLIQMEEKRSNVMTYLPLGNGFLFKIGKNAMEERITAIMKIKKKSLPATLLAAVLVLSVTAVFASSAAGKTAKPRKAEANLTAETTLTKEEYEKLQALQFQGYEELCISDYQKKVWALTDTKEYRNLLERISQNETLYAIYEGNIAADKNTKELLTFYYNILEPLTAERWQTRDFSGAAATDFPRASDNAILEYTVTLSIQDADQLTVDQYNTARQYVMEDLKHIFETREWNPVELRDEELMHTTLDEEIDSIKWSWENESLRITIAYHYTPLGELPIDEMADWQQESFDKWEAMLAPYVPFGVTYRYDQKIDEFRMYFEGKEVRAIYDTEQYQFISTHLGIGEGIYADDAIDLYAEYDDGKITGLREATQEEMAEATEKRLAVTNAYKRGQEEYSDRLREELPATEEDYQSLFTLKTSAYRAKTIAEFNEELLEWTNHNFDRKERIAVDNFYEDYRVILTEEEKAFAAVTAHFSGMENAAYVRSIQKNEPVRDVVETVSLRSKQEVDRESGRSAWCSLHYAFSYHISDKETVRVGERDDCLGGMMDSIRGYWESSTVDQLVSMTEEEMLETLQAIAEKYSSQRIRITLLEDQVAFETMDERMHDETERIDTAEQAGLQDIDTITINGKVYYMIATESQLRSIRECGLDKNYMQQNDIEISEDAWLPIGTPDNPFTGSYNGNGFKIMRFADRHSHTTLFGSAEGADLYNITFSNKNTERFDHKDIVCEYEKDCRIYDIFFEV